MDLKSRRQELNLTLQDVAKAVGVSEATVSRWESGEIANMRRNRITALAQILKVSPSFIMDWEDKHSNEIIGDSSMAALFRLADTLNEEGKAQVTNSIDKIIKEHLKKNNDQ
jgi:Predicted transcriptional regulators